jgi:hypothetical protein
MHKVVLYLIHSITFKNIKLLHVLDPHGLVSGSPLIGVCIGWLKLRKFEILSACSDCHQCDKDLRFEVLAAFGDVSVSVIRI